MLAEAVAAALVGLALLWLVVQPMIMPGEGTHASDEPPDAEETPHGRALLALKEIEFDRATGKLSDDDFAALHAKYSALAVRELERADQHATATADAWRASRPWRRSVDGGDGATRLGRAVPGPVGAPPCSACGAPVSRHFTRRRQARGPRPRRAVVSVGTRSRTTPSSSFPRI